MAMEQPLISTKIQGYDFETNKVITNGTSDVYQITNKHKSVNTVVLMLTNNDSGSVDSMYDH